MLGAETMPVLRAPRLISFDTAFERLLGHEGALSLDRKDPGNWTGGRVGVGELKGTKYGLSAATYPDLNIAAITIPEARAIYYRDWWLRAGGDVFDPAVMFQLWDFAINSGMGNAVRMMQRVVGVAEDGAVGPVTIAAVRAMDLNDFLLRFLAARLRFLASLQTWPTYGRGWARRVADNLDFAAHDNIDLGGITWTSSPRSSPAQGPAFGLPPPAPPSLESSGYGSAPSEPAEPSPPPKSSAPVPSATKPGGLLSELLRLLRGSAKQ